MKHYLTILFIIFAITTSNSYSFFREEIKCITIIEDKEEKITRLINVIKQFETYKAENYILFGQNLIGYGHHNIEGFKVIDKDEATELLYKDFFYNYNILKDITNQEYRLLLSALAYNIGIGKVLNSGIYKVAKKDVSKEKFKQLYLQYCYINGKYNKQLYKRRLKEFNAVTKNYHKLIIVWNNGK